MRELCSVRLEGLDAFRETVINRVVVEERRTESLQRQKRVEERCFPWWQEEPEVVDLVDNKIVEGDQF